MVKLAWHRQSPGFQFSTGGGGWTEGEDRKERAKSTKQKSEHSCLSAFLSFYELEKGLGLWPGTFESRDLLPRHCHLGPGLPTWPLPQHWQSLPDRDCPGSNRPPALCGDTQASDRSTSIKSQDEENDHFQVETVTPATTPSCLLCKTWVFLLLHSETAS